MLRRRSVRTLLLVILGGLLPALLLWFLPSVGRQIPELTDLPLRSMSPLEQTAQAIAGLLIKPVYMLLSLVVIVALVDQPGRDQSALLWGQVAFLTGEVFCAVNFYFYNHQSILSEYLHSYGMVIAFGFTVFAAFETLDVRLLKLSISDSACAALPMCGVCTRRRPEGCKARSLARFFLPVLAALALIPLLSPVQPDTYAVTVFGVPYSYARFDLYEIYERRILPGLAIICFVGAWIPVLKRSGPAMPDATKVLASAGLGALGFSFFRLILNSIFARDLVWFEFWEEATELLYVGSAAFLLWKFRRTLLKSSAFVEYLSSRT